MRIDMYGRRLVDVDVTGMRHPMRCRFCDKVHDASTVEVVHRYADCSTWRCPGCKVLIDDRAEGWGGSALPVEREVRHGSD